jgi:hypothetical protein
MRLASVDDIHKAINHPTVGPVLNPDLDWIDMSGFYRQERPNIAFVDDNGGVILFINEGGGLFEGHFAFLPRCKGKELIENSFEAMRRLFTQHNARVIKAHPPRENRAARLVLRRLGFSPVGELIDPAGRECKVYSITKDKWLSDQRSV